MHGPQLQQVKANMKVYWGCCSQGCAGGEGKLALHGRKSTVVRGALVMLGLGTHALGREG